MVGHDRHGELTGPGAHPAACGAVRHRDGELQGRRSQELRPRYESLKAINPRLNLLFAHRLRGQNGPYAQRAGYDFMIQGMGRHHVGHRQPDGAPGAEAMKVGVAFADILPASTAPSHPGGALSSRSARDRAIHRRGAAGLASRRPRQPGAELSGGRQGADAHGQRASQHRALPDLRHEDGFIIMAVATDRQFKEYCASSDCPIWRRTSASG